MDESFCPFLPNFRGEDIPKNTSKKGAKNWFSRRSSSAPTNASSGASAAGPLVIFVLGGITYAEIQTAYELMVKHNLDVYIGGTHLVTATSFIEKDLKSLMM